MLEHEGIDAEREVRLSERDRVDFMAAGVAVEVKVDGRAAQVLRQVARYCEHDDVAAVLLVTNRVRHGLLPAQLHGKPIEILNLSEIS